MYNQTTRRSRGLHGRLYAWFSCYWWWLHFCQQFKDPSADDNDDINISNNGNNSFNLESKCYPHLQYNNCTLRSAISYHLNIQKNYGRYFPIYIRNTNIGSESIKLNSNIFISGKFANIEILGETSNNNNINSITTEIDLQGKDCGFILSENSTLILRDLILSNSYCRHQENENDKEKKQK